MRFTPRQIARTIGLAAAGIGVLLLVIGPFIGRSLSPETVLTVEPISYAGAIALIVGLALATGTFLFFKESDSRESVEQISQSPTKEL